MDRRTFVAGLGGVAVGLFLGRRDAPAADPVRLGFQVNIWGSLSVVALKSGAFEKMGLTVEGIQAPVGRQTRDAMVAGTDRLRHVRRPDLPARGGEGRPRRGRPRR